MTTRPGTPEYYTDEAGEVRWRVQDSNGEITEASSDGFVNLRKAHDNYSLTRGNVHISYQEAQDQYAGTDSPQPEPSGTGGLIADSDGSQGQEADGSGDTQAARGPAAGGSGADDQDPSA